MNGKSIAQSAFRVAGLLAIIIGTVAGIAVLAILACVIIIYSTEKHNVSSIHPCLSNEMQLGLAFNQYSEDYDGRWPYGNGGPQGWAGSIYPYVRSKEVFHCPDDPTESDADIVAGRPKNVFPVSYAYNSNIDAVGDGNGGRGVIATNSMFSSPKSTVVLCEFFGTQSDIQDSPELSASPSPPANGNCYPSSLPPGVTYETGQIQNNFLNMLTEGIHTCGSNYLLADGHAFWMLGPNVSGGVDNYYGPKAPSSIKNATTTPMECYAAGTGSMGQDNTKLTFSVE